MSSYNFSTERVLYSTVDHGLTISMTEKAFKNNYFGHHLPQWQAQYSAANSIQFQGHRAAAQTKFLSIFNAPNSTKR